jgi:hypothetical protein
MQKSSVHERVAADRALLAALVRGELDLYFHDGQLTDPRRWHGEDDFALRAGDLTCRPAHLGAANAL